MSDTGDLRSRCHNILPGHGAPKSIAANLRDIADSLAGDELSDVYGEGGYLADFETEIAARFAKSAAVFMPSGTMAQQIALRLWCDRSGSTAVAMHASSHLETAEHSGYQFLHKLHRLQFGSPEGNINRLVSLADLQALPQKPGAILLEIPCRPMGGELPEWQELEALCGWAREKAIPVHLDGARIWQCEEAYGRSHAEIGALFDSIYVSFYKDLGGLAGCMLLGPENFIQQSRVWQRRHGGNLYSQAPYVAAARRGLATCLPRLPDWNRKAREIAAIVNGIEGLRTRPLIPRVNFFQVYLEGEVGALERAHKQTALDTGTFVFPLFRATAVPGLTMAELHCWGNSMTFDIQALAPFLTRMMATAAVRPGTVGE